MSDEIAPQELETLMMDTSPYMDEMGPKDYDFFFGTFERWKKYKERTTLSPKQVKWLRDIHARYVTGSGADDEYADPNDDLPY